MKKIILCGPKKLILAALKEYMNDYHYVIDFITALENRTVNQSLKIFVYK